MVVAVALAGVGLVAVLLGGLVAPWARVPAGVVAGAILAAAAVACVWWFQSHSALAGRRASLVAHAVAAALTASLGTALVYASVRLTEPENVAAFLRGPIYWSVTWWLVVYALVATVAQAVRTRERLRSRELAAARAELHALRARLDPHFLFNTLHSLSVLVRDDRDRAEEALEQFGELMRYVLRTSRAGDDVALADEIGFVRSYLALEKLRLGDRLRVVEDLDDDALDCAVPPLLVQPLVENAIRHGIAPLLRGGTLGLSARQEGALVSLVVRDDGAGADERRVARGTGLGLQAVAQVLAARFPGRHRLEVTTRPGAGFAVRVELPAEPHPVRGAARAPASRRRAS